MATSTSGRTDTTFPSGRVRCAAWHYAATSDALATQAGRPCVVMAHGFGGTRDSGLEGFAEAFAAAGADAVLFDFRGFGASEGEPRQLVDVNAQLADYAAGLEFARSLGEVDPARVVAWGVSLSGGHVFRVAAGDARLAAVISLTPATDVRALARGRSKKDAPLGNLVSALRDRKPLYLPLIDGEPGTFAGYREIVGPTWVNAFSVTLRTLATLMTYRPGSVAKHVDCPVLVQIADLDQSAPPIAAGDAARKLRVAEVRHYPCDHFDVYAGAEWFGPVVRHQVEFLTRRLSPPGG
jgi:fermentation-respiration switch protein FrsA (DUF1100 family)